MSGTQASSTLSSESDGKQDAREAVPHLFRVLSASDPLSPPWRHRLDGLTAITVGRGDDDAERRAGTLAIAVADGRVSQSHARLSQALGRWVLEDLGSRNKTFRNGVEVKQQVALSDGDIVEIGHTAFVFRAGLVPDEEASADFCGEFHDGTPAGLATMMPSLARSFRSVATLATSEVPILVLGESGTGKELIGSAVHSLSRRRGSFIAVNCGALPETLVESELFGAQKGAYSGAVADRPGLIRSADGGTLFLDEIGDLPGVSQAAFLRALQERQVTPVGGAKPIDVDFRLCAATHRPLESLVEEGHFRMDLYARISGHTLSLPPLRSRREDTGLFVAALLRRHAADRAEDLELGKDVLRELLARHWSLNIRELERCLQTSVVLATDGVIRLEHLPAPLSAPKAVPSLSPEDTERRAELVALLTQHKGNVSAVARAMNRQRVQIRRWLERYSLDAESFR